MSLDSTFYYCGHNNGTSSKVFSGFDSDKVRKRSNVRFKQELIVDQNWAQFDECLFPLKYHRLLKVSNQRKNVNVDDSMND